NQVIPEKLRQAAEKETDPALRLYLNWLAYPEESGIETDLAMLSELLQQKLPDWPRVLRLLLQVTRQTAKTALPIVRKANLNSLPNNLLPVLVGFFCRFGDSMDVDLLESWCSDQNPAVTILAVEGLSRIQPDRLRDFLYPLLTSESAGIRSRAIRILHRWHPEEALRQLCNMLESEIIDERRAALAHAFFLPFDRIKHDLIRFLIRESEPALLVQAGQLLIINPDIEMAKSVATVAVETSAEKAPVIKNILLQQCEFLARIKLIEERYESYTNQLLAEATNKADEKRAASLAAAIRDGQIQNESDLTRATALLKQKFSLDLPVQSLLPVLESLALINPAFLQPYLPKLLQIRDFKIQIAALAALAKINPVNAEQMLEQYLCSATPARRRTGIKVLARLDRDFARPLLLKTLSQETDKELLELIESQLNDPLPRETLMQLVRASRLTEECNERMLLLKRLCQSSGINPEEAEVVDADCDFSQETIMLGRAEKQITAPSVKPAKQSAEDNIAANASVAENSQFANQYLSLPAYARLRLIIDAMSKQELVSEDLTDLLKQESSEFQRFALQSALTGLELSRRKNFSPVQTLKQNLSLNIPVWTEVAACLARLTPEAARLAAPSLQRMRWTSWPDALMPFALRTVSLTAKPAFSASVNNLLRHNRPEIRCAAIECLFDINPGDLIDSLPELIDDKDPEVSATACKVTQAIEDRLRPDGNATDFSSAFSNLFYRLQKLSTLYQAAIAIVIILLFSLFLLSGQPYGDSGNSMPLPVKSGHFSPSAKKNAPLHRFEHWHQSAEPGQERVIFGRIEENYADSLLVQSPALKATVLVRHDRGSMPLAKNQHFNGRVRIDSVNGGRIESTLLPVQENNR
ncbi:MAG: HEAT repeat domain-containing protein, partial [Candidatus Riflebacteria bacterium]|nr:HEAT repeat domain-containing protein [Candidatus Riflebacteria bacterium]